MKLSTHTADTQPETLAEVSTTSELIILASQESLSISSIQEPFTAIEQTNVVALVAQYNAMQQPALCKTSENYTDSVAENIWSSVSASQSLLSTPLYSVYSDQQAVPLVFEGRELAGTLVSIDPEPTAATAKDKFIPIFSVGGLSESSFFNSPKAAELPKLTLENDAIATFGFFPGLGKNRKEPAAIAYHTETPNCF